MRIFFQLNAEKFKRINKKIRASFPAYKISIADLPESEVGRLCMTTGGAGPPFSFEKEESSQA